MLLTCLYVLLALLVFYAYLVSLKKTDEAMLGTALVMGVLLAVAFDGEPSLRTFGIALLVAGVFVVVTTRKVML